MGSLQGVNGGRDSEKHIHLHTEGRWEVHPVQKPESTEESSALPDGAQTEGGSGLAGDADRSSLVLSEGRRPHQK